MLKCLTLSMGDEFFNMTLAKGKFRQHIKCTSPACTSSDGMAVYQLPDGSYDATCFVCGYYDADPYANNAPATQGQAIGTKTQSQVYSSLTVDQITSCPTRGIPSREIKQTTAEQYGVRTLLNGLDGQTPVAIAFPYYNIYNNIIGYKKRLLEDKIFNTIGDCSLDNILLFGQQLYTSGGKKLYITEGEIDCLSLYQVLKDLASPEWKHLEPCVVSLPHGSKSAASALGSPHVRPFLDKFEEIILAFDQDDAGREAVSQVCSFLPPQKIRVANFSEKDANEMLMKGKASELKWSVLTQAKAYQPEGITTSKELLADALRKPTVGSEWPWPSLTKLTYGRHPGLYCVGAGVGIGKTEFFHELVHHIACVERRPVGVFLLEEAPARTVKILGGKQLNVPVHRPDAEFDHANLLRAIEALSDPRELLYVFDHKGSRDWDSIFTQAKYLAAVHGVRDIIIDPLTAIISHEENTDRALHKLMDDMSRLAQSPYNCTVYFSSHLNEPPRDRRPHEEGGRVHESQFAGSRAMIRFSNYVIGLERDKQAQDSIERNTTTVRILKDRDFGTASGETFQIFYDQSTGRYLEQNLEF
jgi:twinkle protein